MAAHLAFSGVEKSVIQSGTPQGNEASMLISNSVSDLITTAKSHLEQDHELACLCLMQAVNLLRKRNDEASKAHKKTGSLVSWQIRRLNTHIDQHLSAEIKTGELAEVLGLSVSHFTRSFKQTLGISPQAYIVRKRIDAACRMMLETDEPLTRIAHIHGFYDHSHFTRKFHLETGSSPQAWRKLHAQMVRQPALAA